MDRLATRANASTSAGQHTVGREPVSSAHKQTDDQDGNSNCLQTIIELQCTEKGMLRLPDDSILAVML